MKQKTRAKRAQGKEMMFVIHDKMNIAKIIIKELLSVSKQRHSSETFFVKPFWRNTKDQRKRWWS
jgi:hypothetical protein